MITGLILGLVQATYMTCQSSTNYVGYYDSGLDKIVICENYEKDNGIAYHEFGHWLRYKKLSAYERGKYKRIMDRETDCVTPYSCTSLEESFAENTRFVLNKNKVDTDKKKFIRGLLRKYEVYY